MTEIFSAGTTVTSVNGNEYTIRKLLGSGGQGEVYRVNGLGRDWALKWYYPGQATQEQRDNIEKLIERGAPNSSFLWPIEFIANSRTYGFGYIMPLREDNFRSIVDLLKRRASPTFFSLLTAAFNLCDSFHELHAKGLCYQDISYGNVFFDEKTGKIAVCDNDNVVVNKHLNKSLVLGTQRFMAPEIVLRDATPSTETDQYSLAILLFYMLFISHPLDGKREQETHCFDAAAMRKLYGENPVFIFDPNDKSNRPDPIVHKNALIFWNIYPNSLKRLFTKVFTEGIRDTVNGRVSENVWQSKLLAARDSIFYCKHCNMENFFDPTRSDNPRCWNCQSSLTLPPQLKMGSHIVMLNPNSVLYKHQIGAAVYDIVNPIAQVVPHPQHPSVMGLRNLSSGSWALIKKDGILQEVEPQKAVTITDDIEIDFGSTRGQISGPRLY